MYVNNCSLYADDAMTEATGTSVEEVVTSLQCNINQLNDWFKHNHLTVNASKCCTMLIGSRQRIGDFVSLPTIGLCLDGVQITNSNTYTYLGVHFDSLLTFDKICNKLSGRVAMLYRMSNYMPYYHLLSMYNAFIQPFIDYYILIWGSTSSTNIQRIQKFQNRSARIITKLYGYDLSGLSIVKMLGWLNVKQRYDFLFCSLIHKCLFGTVPRYLSDNLVQLDDVQQRDTRLTGQNMLHVPFARTSLFSRSFSVNGPSLWNALPLNLRFIQNINEFKACYKSIMLS